MLYAPRLVMLVFALVLLPSTWTGADLTPRQPLPKQQRVVEPEFPSRLVIKFVDQIKARAAGDGGLIALQPADLDPLEAMGNQHGASFTQLIRLPQETLDFLENRAANASGVAQPDLAGMMVVSAPADNIEALANALNTLDIVEWVSFESVAPPPPALGDGCQDIAPTTPLYHTQQTYHGPDPGINMTAAWDIGNTRGAGIQVADCEYGIVLGHEDLCDVIMEPGQTIHPDVIDFGWDEHGTAVMGEIQSGDNSYGCLGLVPDTQGLFFTEWSVEEGFRRATCIANAVATVDTGDIVVLEMQNGAGGPAEIDQSVWTITKNATDAGILVIGAAGNGNQNLDGANYATYRARGDSGAIIVGAGTSNSNHDKLSFSTYGSRVNVQAWGQNVFTLGYGHWAQHGGDKNQRYTNRFGGTSSATPIVVGAAAALQSLAEAELGRRLAPLEMRQLLIDTGIPQGSGGHIGPIPDVLAAANQLLADVFREGELESYSVLAGAELGGGLPELGDSDDAYLQLRSEFGMTLIEPFITDVQFSFQIPAGDNNELVINVESRITEPVGTAKVFVENQNTGEFDQVHSYLVGDVDAVESIGDLDAQQYVSGDGEVQIRVRHVVFAAFFSFSFESLHDHVEALVR